MKLTRRAMLVRGAGFLAILGLGKPISQIRDEETTERQEPPTSTKTVSDMYRELGDLPPGVVARMMEGNPFLEDLPMVTGGRPVAFVLKEVRRS